MAEKEIRLPFRELSAGGRTYMLRLTAHSAVRFEERLGMSVYKALERVDEVKMTAELLYALIESLRPEIRMQEVYSIIDDYISDGGTISLLDKEIAEALKLSGFFASAPTV